MNTIPHSTVFSLTAVTALRRSILSLVFCLILSFPLLAQTDDEEFEDEDEDVKEEKALVDNRPSKKEDVTITLNGAHFLWKDQIHIKRNDTLDISVRDLAPASRVEIIAEKGGINLTRKVYYSNQDGELDLEVRIGNKKMKGKANLIYTPSGGGKKEKQVEIILD